MTETLAQPNAAAEIMLIDLSAIAVPIWMMCSAEPDPNACSQRIVARIRQLADQHPKAAICCDSGRSFRKDIAESYKANRPESEAPMHHQIALAREQLQADGFPVWAAKGFEADDVIATATAQAVMSGEDYSVLIVSGDKDLLQLVSPRVRAMSSRDGAIFDEAGVKAKLGVRPDQVKDYLSLVGDASDNIKGATKVGPKTAAELLAKYGSIDGIFGALDTTPTQFTPGLATNLREFQPRVELTRSLVALRFDVELPFADVFDPRVPKEVATFGDMDEEDELQPPTAERTSRGMADCVDAAEEQVTNGVDRHDLPGEGALNADASSASRQTSLALLDPATPAPAEYERQLDPRSMKDAISLAKNMYESRLFSAYGTPQAVLSTVMLGRELGLPAMASLRGVHIIEGRHALAASTMVALILKSGLAEYFEPVEFNDQHAIWITKRKGARAEVRMEHTIGMAVQAGLVKPKGNWEKVPVDMLNARCQSRLARMVYPDVVGGLYTPDELVELREQVA